MIIATEEAEDHEEVLSRRREPIGLVFLRCIVAKVDIHGAARGNGQVFFPKAVDQI
jgi:hypothetical protein